MRDVTLDGRYLVGDPIGHGATSTVYRAQDLALGRYVAVKVVKRAGIDGEEAIKLIGMFDLKGMTANRGLNMAKGNFTPSFELAMARKDVKLMLETAGDLPMAALPAIAARMDQLIAAGHGAEDASVLAIDALPRP